MAAGRKVDRQLLDGRDVVAQLGCSPNDDLEDLVVLEEAAHDDARQHARGGPPDLTGLQADTIGRGEVDRDLDGRLLGHAGDFGTGDIRHLGDGVADGRRALLQRVELLAVDPDDELGCGLRQDRRDAFGRERPDLGVDAGIARDDGTDGVKLLVIVAVGVEAQPQFTRIDVDDLVGQQGAADMPGDILDTGHGAQLVGDLRDDAVHLRS